MSNNSDQINHIIKLDIGELNQENPSESNENDENKENSENFNTSNKEYSSNNNPEIKLEEDEQNNLKNNSKINQKNNSKNATKKAKSRRSRLTIDPQEESTPQHPKKIYTEEEKIKKANENTFYYNYDLVNKRNELNIHFLKRKIEQSYERDDKLQVFFNVPFFPKEEMFSNWQLISNNNYLYNMNRNAQYNKMGMMQNRNINYPNQMRYANNNVNNNSMIKNNNIGSINNNVKNYGQSNFNMNNNNTNNTQNNIKNMNNLNQMPKTQNNNQGLNNKVNPSSTINNNVNNSNIKQSKPILDTSLLKDSNNKFNAPINKHDTNIRKNPLFALTTDSPNKNDINQSRKKENENNNEIKENPKEENNEVKEIDIDNKEENKN